MDKFINFIKTNTFVLAVLYGVILSALLYMIMTDADKSKNSKILLGFFLILGASIWEIFMSFKTNKSFLFQKIRMRSAVFSLLFLPFYAKDFWLIGNEFNKLCLILLFIFLVYQVYNYYKSGLLKFDGSFFSNEY